MDDNMKTMLYNISVKITWLLFFALFLNSGAGWQDIISYGYAWDDDYTKVKSIIAPYKSIHEERIIGCVVKFSYRYRLSPVIVTRLIAAESDFRVYACSPVYYARGLMQIRDCWDHVLYKVDNGRLAKTLLQQTAKENKKYWYRIGYNIEAGCYILSNHIAKYGAELALVAYNHGEYSKYFYRVRRNRKLLEHNSYVKKILD